MPRGLLDFARRIRHHSKDLRHWCYVIWLHDVYPEDFMEYMRKCKEAIRVK